MLYNYCKKIGIFCLLLSVVSHANAQTDTFNYTGSVQTWTAPACISYVLVDAMGATGGTGIGYSPPTTIYNVGGSGGRVRCKLTVVAGQTLSIYIGGRGIDATIGMPAIGGYNGGGNVSTGTFGVGGSGGGATDIRITPYSLTERVVVAAGGGGGGGLDCGDTTANANPNRGGAGGGSYGSDGWSCGAPTSIYSGYGASPTSGGGGGTGLGPDVGGPGTWGNGGNGAYLNSGGGGGGGLYGGGGGYSDGGGGGSSFADPALATSIIHTAGFNGNGNGRVILTVVPCDSTVSVDQITESDLNIYPDPATDWFVIASGGAKYNSLTVTDGMGRLYIRKETPAMMEKLDIRELPAGIYYISLQNDKTRAYRRFVKK